MTEIRALQSHEAAPVATQSAVVESLRRCIETLRPYTGKPIGSKGSAARREQDDKAAAYAEAIYSVGVVERDLGLLRDDPNFVHINMLRGTIAKPTWRQIEHLYPEESAAPAGADWRTIDSAPKGRKVIAGHFNGVGKWRSYMATYYLPGTLDASETCDNSDDDGYAPEGWYEESETQDEILPIQPTHWMPLPAGPKPEGE